MQRNITQPFKKKQNNAICNNMDGPEIIILSADSQTETDKCHMILFICGYI